ncbi:protein phosphatase CheZ [Vibrio sp. Vb2880]|uniref:Protein phosphatase CheZ n=1 Tax=Vibrio furnissii TaxID=29494 RepID=A0A0Q2R5H2_VIBFU|nr:MULTISPECIES: protein phosphatase CheZ [Vibrio]ADT86440.1 chemotaxis protein CheZ [Vibrio furnissii NCTC 11218]EEX42336.1 chemotaxis response - phosphatase CheZ [Vibrio furnissii CIP 102972]KQH87357.1 protein phosphatase [Vibrio furnissii]MBO0212522.1 protein phosphatase CheZ [Vibrio sp. Vb2880]MCG6214368.1 protein phosphatase CheZ [Vibrio furnissii]
MISLEQAKELVQLLENGQQDSANLLLKQMYESERNPMLQEIGELTRELHDSLKQFHIDDRMSEIANDEIPDARDRLQYVIEKTEIAANKTMDAVDRCMPIADSLHESLLLVRPQWNELMHGKIELSEFKALCHRIDNILSQIEGDSSELRGQLTEILMAQDFQDLTGQIIRRVITLVNEVEKRLVDILTVFGSNHIEQQDKAKKASTDPEGPILNPHERSDAVSSQDEVDDLLSSLGF